MLSPTVKVSALLTVIVGVVADHVTSPVTVSAPLMVVLSDRVICPDPASMVMSPVSDPPMVSVLLSVVERLPPDEIYAPPAVDEAATEATGVPELMLRTANLAEEVA